VLEELVIENYAVVDRLEVRFHAGLNLLTGETGSGKSIVVDALGLLLGSRASTDMIRSGAERARVSGVFEIGPSARKLLAEAGFDGEGAELLLDREILSTGKGRVWINNRPATVALLKDLAPHLGDIHGQHDQQLLFDSEAQLDLLDTFAANEKLLLRIAELFAAWKKAADAIRALESSEKEKLRLLDLWQFQRREIDAAELKPGEDAELEAERRIQQNAGRLLENAGAAYETLYDSPESALTLARAAAKKIDELARIDPAMESVRQVLEPALIAIQDVAYSLRDYLGRVEANPSRLEEVEARLVAIERLKRKYGGSVEEIIAFGEEAARNIAEVETSGERLEELKREHQLLAAEFEKAAAELSAGRKSAALRLSKRVEQELKPLAMDRTRFAIHLDAAEWSETGTDRAAFLVSPNVGEEPRPLESVASGGELSRIALALKTCLVGGHKSGPPRTLVFDEIDAGIGGRAAEGVARRLRSLAAENQVLCVTHLAQIACFADHHYRVGKSEQSGRTVAEIEELSQKESTEEIGRMLSGRNITPEALRNAAELIRSARADTLVSEA
jgi:DNA repair protein RecN (Recombination protein N)